MTLSTYEPFQDMNPSSNSLECGHRTPKWPPSWTASLPFFFFCFLGLHLQHMEVSRLGVKLEIQLLAYAIGTEIQAIYVTYTTAHGNTTSVTHWARPGIEPTSSWILVSFINRWAMKGTPALPWCLCHCSSSSSYFIADFFFFIFCCLQTPNVVVSSSSVLACFIS